MKLPDGSHLVKGHPDAVFAMGCTYYEGKGVPQDFVAAAMLFQKGGRSRSCHGAV